MRMSRAMVSNRAKVGLPHSAGLLVFALRFGNEPECFLRGERVTSITLAQHYACLFCVDARLITAS
jgi:hypothetical protein